MQYYSCLATSDVFRNNPINQLLQRTQQLTLLNAQPDPAVFQPSVHFCDWSSMQA